MCDTDSFIFVDKSSKLEHYRRKFCGKTLGSWELEGISGKWEICTLKVYRFGDDVKYKGVYGKAEDLVRDGRITNSVKIEIWGRGRDGKLTVRKQVKKMSFKYDKGVVGLEGPGTVTPFTF